MAIGFNDILTTPCDDLRRLLVTIDCEGSEFTVYETRDKGYVLHQMESENASKKNQRGAVCVPTFGERWGSDAFKFLHVSHGQRYCRDEELDAAELVCRGRERHRARESEVRQKSLGGGKEMKGAKRHTCSPFLTYPSLSFAFCLLGSIKRVCRLGRTGCGHRKR